MLERTLGRNDYGSHVYYDKCEPTCNRQRSEHQAKMAHGHRQQQHSSGPGWDAHRQHHGCNKFLLRVWRSCSHGHADSHACGNANPTANNTHTYINTSGYPNTSDHSNAYINTSSYPNTSDHSNAYINTSSYPNTGDNPHTYFDTGSNPNS
jgi:hypothetical protein